MLSLPKPPRALIRLPTLLYRLGIASATAYDHLNPSSPRYDANFPRQVAIGRGAVAWASDEVDDYINALIEARPDRPVQAKHPDRSTSQRRLTDNAKKTISRPGDDA